MNDDDDVIGNRLRTRTPIYTAEVWLQIREKTEDHWWGRGLHHVLASSECAVEVIIRDRVFKGGAFAGGAGDVSPNEKATHLTSTLFL